MFVQENQSELKLPADADPVPRWIVQTVVPAIGGFACRGTVSVNYRSSAATSDVEAAISGEEQLPWANEAARSCGHEVVDERPRLAVVPLHFLAQIAGDIQVAIRTEGDAISVVKDALNNKLPNLVLHRMIVFVDASSYVGSIGYRMDSGKVFSHCQRP